jgi:hypothetical protein
VTTAGYGRPAAPVSIASGPTLALALGNTRGPKEHDGVLKLSVKISKDVIWIHLY